MYISGVPGTGKTATVMQVIKKLVEEFSGEKEAKTDTKTKESINSLQSKFTFVEVNGMKMINPEQVYIQIYKQITGVTSEQACNLLNQSFTSPKNNRQSKPNVLLVDDLDLLWTKKQTVMYNLFDWPSNTQSGLIVVAIANTMDLPERVMMARVASRLGLTRLTFPPTTRRNHQIKDRRWAVV